MKFEEAFKLLREGKRVRRACWSPTEFVIQAGNELLNHRNTVASGYGWFFDDWEEYRDPVEAHAEKLCNVFAETFGSTSEWQYASESWRNAWCAVARVKAA